MAVFRIERTRDYTLVTPQGKLHFAELRDLILMVV